MTLRDALAAALGNVYAYTDLERQADAILSDPVFREALVEAVAEALGDTGHRNGSHLWCKEVDDCGIYSDGSEDARAIVERMLT